jgi:hypothetical protein
MTDERVLDDTMYHGAIQVRVPATARQTATVRIVAASLAAEAGFDADQIDDLRLGVGEAAGAVIEAAGEDSSMRLQVTFEISPRRIDATMELLATSRPHPDMGVSNPPAVVLDELATRILSVLVDHVAVSAGRLHLSKTVPDAFR